MYVVRNAPKYVVEYRTSQTHIMMFCIMSKTSCKTPYYAFWMYFMVKIN